MKTPSDWLDRAARFLWAAALLTLPVTSFRWFPFLGDATLVRPLALYPLALLVPALVIQWLRGERRFPRSGSIPMLGLFALSLIASAALGLLFNPVPLRGQAYAGRAIRALATLIIGLIFFLCAAGMNRDERDMRFTARWLFAGLGLDLAWIGLQAVTFYTPLLRKEMVTHWQLAFSMRELVRTNRISGLAYEPAWLAGQIATTYLPVLFAAVLSGTRLTRRRWMEPVLLALCTLALLATYSRGGILIALGAAVLTFLILGRGLMRRARAWFTGGFRTGWLLRLGLAGLVLAVLMASVFFLSRKNYFRRLWNPSAGGLVEYVVSINAGARSAYASGALAAFDGHPLTGVGPGASGLWIYGHLPDWSLTTVPEIARQLDPGSRLYPNPKNLYVRLLAEAGLIGFVFYFVFLFASFAEALQFLGGGALWRWLGIAGFFAWAAIALYNVTQDSFATPNIWLIPGMLAGLANAMDPEPARGAGAAPTS
ncbi:MAG: O-antigen ligase family protein [Bacteroidota bacterium]